MAGLQALGAGQLALQKKEENQAAAVSRIGWLPISAPAFFHRCPFMGILPFLPILSQEQGAVPEEMITFPPALPLPLSKHHLFPGSALPPWRRGKILPLPQTGESLLPDQARIPL